jgi:hypothetical protein
MAWLSLKNSPMNISMEMVFIPGFKILATSVSVLLTSKALSRMSSIS